MTGKADRKARLERAKAIGRVAYSHVRWANIFGNMPVDGEEKQLRELTERRIVIELYYPFRPTARPDEFSRLQIRVHGHKVFEIRWDKTGYFKVVAFEPGNWEGRCALGRRQFRFSGSVCRGFAGFHGFPCGLGRRRRQLPSRCSAWERRYATKRFAMLSDLAPFLRRIVSSARRP